MPIYRGEQIQLKSSFLFWAAACVLFIPIEWLFSWLLAVIVHEFSHYLALKLCRVRIHSISVNLSGAVIETEAMPVYKEVLSALAGPLGGFCVLFLARYAPAVAICAFFQSIYNLLPIYPLDGGRILRCCFVYIFGNIRGVWLYDRFEVIFAVIVVVLSVVAFCVIRLPMLAALVVLLLFKDKHLKSPCKEEKQIVQ